MDSLRRFPRGLHHLQSLRVTSMGLGWLANPRVDGRHDYPVRRRRDSVTRHPGARRTLCATGLLNGTSYGIGLEIVDAGGNTETKTVSFPVAEPEDAESPSRDAWAAGKRPAH